MEKDTRAPPNSTHPLTRAEWRDWLAAHHTRDEGIWLISYKKATGLPAMTYDEAVEEALCWGWVDSKPRKLDEERSMLYYAPRQGGSGWSRLNKERVERAIATGQMTAAGLAKVEEAKADGTWSCPTTWWPNLINTPTPVPTGKRSLARPNGASSNGSFRPSDRRRGPDVLPKPPD